MDEKPNPGQHGKDHPLHHGEEKPKEPLGAGPAASNSGDGILKAPMDSRETIEQNLWMRQRHNANHALCYLTMIVYCVIHGKAEQNTGQKTERILAHLSSLREFSGQEDQGTKLVIELLFKTLVTEYPGNHAQWTHFVYGNWNLLQNFAKRFDQEKTCFHEEDYQKVSDVLHHRHFLTMWWWRVHVTKTYRKWRGIVKDSIHR